MQRRLTISKSAPVACDNRYGISVFFLIDLPSVENDA